MIAALLVVALFAGVAGEREEDRVLTSTESECKRDVDELVAAVEHLDIELREARADRDDLAKRLAELAHAPAPPAIEPEAPWWVPWAIASAAVAGAALGAFGAVELARAL